MEKIIKRKFIIVLLAIAIIISALYAYIPVTVEFPKYQLEGSIEYLGENRKALTEEQISLIRPVIEQAKIRRLSLFDDRLTSYSRNEAIEIYIYSTGEPYYIRMYLFPKDVSKSYIECNQKTYLMLNPEQARTQILSLYNVDKTE